MLKPQRSLKSRALQLLAQRDQSRVELRRKLLAHALEAGAAPASDPAGFAAADPAAAQADPADPADIADPADPADPAGPLPDPVDPVDPVDAAAQVDAVLDWLEARRFLSAERFAESRINARAARFGNLRIRHELARHEVAIPPEVEQALADSELARARAVRARKFPAPPATPTENARQARFLGARGFSSDVIRQVLREAARAGVGEAQTEDPTV